LCRNKLPEDGTSQKGRLVRPRPNNTRPWT